MVLLRDLGELLEADSVVLVGVLHAGLRERARHQARAEDALDRADGAIPARGLVRLVLPGRRGTEQAELAHLLQADGQPDAGLAGLDGHRRDAERGRAGRAGIRDVVDRDAGLADLLLDPLPDAVGVIQAARRQDVRIEDRQARVRQGSGRSLAAKVDQVLVLVAHELGHRHADDPQRVGHASGLLLQHAIY